MDIEREWQHNPREEEDFRFPEKTGENDQIEKEFKKETELQLSPELKERIFEKLQDVNAPDVASTVIYGRSSRVKAEREHLPADSLLPDVISKVLTEGVLSHTGEGWSEVEKKEWGKRNIDRSGKMERNVRKVYFTINDRSFSSVHDFPELPHHPPFDSREGRFLNGEWGQPNAVYLFFDLLPYREISPYQNLAPRTYRMNSMGMPGWAYDLLKDDNDRQSLKDIYHLPPGSEKQRQHPAFQKMLDLHIFDNQGRPRSDKEYGFALHGRIPPRLFRGLAVYQGRPLRAEGMEQDITEGISKLMLKIYKDHPENLIPIYDQVGNLVWPERMSYGQVQKVISSRDKKFPHDE